MVLIFISLIIWDVENLFTYFVGYPNVFFEKNVFGNSLPTFYWIVYGGFFGFVFCLLLLSCLGFLCILDIDSSLDIWLANILSHSVHCFFILMISFPAQKLFSLSNLADLLLLLLPLLLVSNLENHHQDQHQGVTACVFF